MRPISYEVKRIASSYLTGIVAEAQGRPGAARSSALTRVVGLFRAKLHYGIGPLYYALYRLSDVPGAKWPDYVTDDPQFKSSLRRMSDASALCIAQNKAMMYEHCVAHEIATIPIFCLLGHSSEQLRGVVPQVRSLEEWRQAMQGVSGELFVKQVDGTYGKGAFIVQPKASKFEFEGRSGSLDDLYHHIARKCTSAVGWIVQPRVKPHPGLQKYVSQNGLPTVRAVTAMVDGKPEVLYMIFKITVGSNTSDNFSKGKSGNLVVAINRSNGRLACPWGSLSTKWPIMQPFPKHPDSQMPIVGEVLPCWREVMALAEQAQASLPGLKSSGWDIAIGKQGPAIVEANTSYDMSILQVAYQRGLRRELDAMLRTAS